MRSLAWLRGAPIRRKLSLASVVASFFAIGTACAFFVAYDIFAERRATIRALETTAETLAYSLAATLDFRSPEDAGSILAALRVQRSIRAALVLSPDGLTFSQYTRPDVAASDLPAAGADGVVLAHREVRLTRGVWVERERLGTLIVVSDLEELRARTRATIVAALVVLALACVISRVLGAYLLRVISDPILSLADVAAKVSESQDYSLRARRFDDDELGLLADSINAMLARIERDTDLEQQRRALESEVRQREEANRQLVIARDRAEAATRAKSQFLANMSHEIRTPLNGAMGMTELLLRTHLTDEQRRLALSGYRSAGALLELINDILDFSKIEAGKLEVYHEPFCLLDVMEEVAVSVSASAHKKSIEVICDVSPDVPASLVGDEGRVRQILMNLAGNAVKFTQRGHVWMRARVLLQSEASVSIELAVKDTGIGISDDLKPRIFEAFVQADGSHARKFGGTGLGLTITRQLVELLRGRFGFESTVHAGSRFVCELPFEVASGATVASLTAMADTRARVLVVDGSARARETILAHLAAWQIPSAGADGLAAARELLKLDSGAPRFDVCMIDSLLPGDSSVQLASELAARASEMRVVLMMRHGERLHAGIEGAAIGAARRPYVLAKPIRLEELAAAVTMRGDEVRPPPTLPAMQGDAPLACPAHVGAHVLVAEDNTVNQVLITEHLRQLGCTFDVVDDGDQAVRAALSRQYDLILMDGQMPALCGFDAARQIRAGEGPRRTPIIAVTATALRNDPELCFAAGMDAFLAKPFTQAELLEKMSDMLQLGSRERPVTGDGHASDGTALPHRARPDDPPRAGVDFEPLRRTMRPAVLQSALRAYLAHTPVVIDRLEAALRDADPTSLERAAHALKSSALALGATDLSARCGELEGLGRSGSMKEATHKVSELLSAERSVRAAVHGELAGVCDEV
jgi:signal transduction histidine kinase/CheY-like chemotaxis protein